MKTCNKYYTGIFKTCIDIIYYKLEIWAKNVQIEPSLNDISS